MVEKMGDFIQCGMMVHASSFVKERYAEMGLYLLSRMPPSCGMKSSLRIARERKRYGCFINHPV